MKLNSTLFAEQSNIENRVTANGILKTLANKNLIQVFKEGGGRTPKTYVLGRLFNILEGRQLIDV
jgi:hypothetical protein